MFGEGARRVQSYLLRFGRTGTQTGPKFRSEAFDHKVYRFKNGFGMDGTGIPR